MTWKFIPSKEIDVNPPTCSLSKTFSHNRYYEEATLIHDAIVLAKKISKSFEFKAVECLPRRNADIEKVDLSNQQLIASLRNL